MRPSSVPPARGRAAARLLAAVLVALGLACTTAAPSSALADGPPWTAAAPGDQRPQVPPNPRVVIPTDTVVSPPAAGFVPEDAGYVPGYGPQRIVGPNVSWGWISWDGTRSGAAAGVHVTHVSRQTGWRFSTTTDPFGRYRAALPDGTYDILLEDPRLPHGTWLDPRTHAPAPYSVGGFDLWNGGMSVGLGLLLYERPLNSCRATPYVVVEGVNGFASGHDDTNTPCAATPEPVPATPWGPDLVDWAVTGKDRAPGPKSSSAPAPSSWPGAVARPVPAAPVVRVPVAGTPRLARTLRLARSGSTTVRVTCPKGAACAGRVTLVPRTGSRRATTGRALATGVLRAGAPSVRLRPTAAGRRALRRGAARARVVWTPAGGRAAVASDVVLRRR